MGVLALAGAIGAAVAARTGGGDGSVAKIEEVQGPFKGASSPFKGALRPPAPRSDFALENQDGKVVRIADERGKVVVLSPMYTSCQDSCPLVAQQIRGALDDLSDSERSQVVAHAVSVDPVNDTPQHARTFLLERRVRGYLDFLVGSRAQLAPVWAEFGFSPQTKEQEHNSYVVLLNRDGRQQVGFPIDFLTPEGLRHDIEVLLARRG
jgi:protein SCO1/2